MEIIETPAIYVLQECGTRRVVTNPPFLCFNFMDQTRKNKVPGTWLLDGYPCTPPPRIAYTRPGR